MPKNRRTRPSLSRGAALCCLLAAGLGAAGAAPALADDVPVVVTGKWATGAPSEATCPKGTELVGGGYESEPTARPDGAPAGPVDMNAPSSRVPNTWVVRTYTGSARAYALCERD
ncbi:hypothetical protein [Streptomyces sp. NPDC095613]|uniref:hypothetical protein n=1 Tax=Streptomyces sp. NPDC095613 TaxID=3155540 RepID=UPI0033348420